MGVDADQVRQRVSAMPRKFHKTFTSYHAAALWCHQRGFDGAVFEEKGGRWTVTVEGKDAERAREEENAKVVPTEAA